jgi:hypothetical protein
MGTSRRSAASTCTCRRGSSWRCWVRAAAARPPCCGSRAGRSNYPRVGCCWRARRPVWPASAAPSAGWRRRTAGRRGAPSRRMWICRAGWRTAASSGRPWRCCVGWGSKVARTSTRMSCRAGCASERLSRALVAQPPFGLLELRAHQPTSDNELRAVQPALRNELRADQPSRDNELPANHPSSRHGLAASCWTCQSTCRVRAASTNPAPARGCSTSSTRCVPPRPRTCTATTRLVTVQPASRCQFPHFVTRT